MTFVTDGTKAALNIGHKKSQESDDKVTLKAPIGAR